MPRRPRRGGPIDPTTLRIRLREKIRMLSPAKKEELLIKAGLQDFATAGEILQTAAEFRDGNSASTRTSDQLHGGRAEQLIRDALSYLGEDDRSELLLDAGMRHHGPGNAIIRAAIDAQNERDAIVIDDGDEDGIA